MNDIPVLDNCGKSSLEDLLCHSKIASCVDGYILPRQENLKRILEAVNSSIYPGNLPVAVLAVIGPKGSGKSFFTNLLIQYLKAEGDGGWMTSIIKKKSVEQGFSWGSVSNKNLFQPKGPDADNSGVYLWPEPFLVKKGGDRKILVWIMHIYSPDNDNEMIELEKFLLLACSRIMEIKVENDEFRILEHYKDISSQLSSISTNPITKEEICSSIVYVIRSTGVKVAAGTDEKAKKAILELMEKAGKVTTDFKEVLDEFQHVNLASLKNFPDPLHNEDGAISKEAAKFMNSSIKKIVESMMDESEIDQKQTGRENKLTLGNMEEFLVAAARKIFSKKFGESGNEEKDSKSKNVSKPARAPMNQVNISQPEMMIEDAPLPKRMEQLKLETLETKSTQANFAPNVEANAHQNEEETTPLKDSQVVPELRKTEESNRVLLPVNREPSEQADHAAPNPINSSSSRVDIPQQQNVIILTEKMESRGEEIQNGYQLRSQQLTESCKKQFMETPLSTPHVPSILPPPPLTPPENQITEEEKMDTTPAPDENNDALPQSSSQPKVSDGIGTALVKTIIPDETEPMEIVDAEAEEAARKLEAEERKKELKLKEEAERAAAEKVKKELIKKQEAEEKLRKDKAKAEMEELANKAVLRIKETLPSSVESWIKNCLNLSTVTQLETVYAELFKNKTIQFKYSIPDLNLRREFVHRVDQSCKAECIQTIKSISNPVLNIYRGIKKKFEFHGYLTQSKLEEVATEELRKAIVPGEDLASKNEMIRMATKKLLEIFTDHNSKIISHEKNAYRRVKSQVTDVYHEQMKRYLKDAPYAPQDFQKIHSKLVDKLVDAFRKALNISKTINEGTTAAEAEDLTKQLDFEFSSHKDANDEKLRKCQEAAKKVNKNMKTQYNEKVEDMLKRNSDGLDATTLAMQHEAIVTEVMKLLELEVRSKIRQNEPLDQHKKSLRNHIDSYWGTVLEVNNKNIKKREEREEKERQEKKKAEAEALRQKMNEKQDISKKGFSTTGDTYRDSPVSTSTSEISKNSEDHRPPLPPLIFHLQSQQVTMAICNAGQVDIMKNESREDQTPAYVTLTQQNKLTYGSEAYAFGTPISGNLNIRWSLADLFLWRDLPWNHVINVNDEGYEISEEFMLGFLLRKLKNAVEYQLRGRCDQALLAVPFWLSSLQRKMIRDAARLAGFSEVYLINEASAAAYNFALGEKRLIGLDDSLILMVSETLDRVDVFIYMYSPGSKKLSMVSHAGNYNLEEEEDRKGRFSYLLEKGATLVNYGKSLFTSSDTLPQQSRNDEIVRDALNAAVHRARLQLHCNDLQIYDAVYVCDNDRKWNGILNPLANSLKSADSYPVINGCAAFANFLKEMGNFIQDKPAYDTLRFYTKTRGTKVIVKEDSLPSNLRNHNSRLTSSVCKVRFGQIVMGLEHTIGELSVSDVGYGAIEPVLGITNEAVVDLSNVFINTKHGNMKSETVSKVTEDKKKWTTPNLTKDKFDELKDLLEKLEPPPPLEDPVLTQAKQELLEKCKSMSEKVESGHFKFKSDMGKTLVLKKINEAREFAEHENSLLDGVQKQMESLEKLCQRYDKP